MDWICYNWKKFYKTRQYVIANKTICFLYKSANVKPKLKWDF